MSEELKRRNSEEDERGKSELGVVIDVEGRRVEESLLGLGMETALGEGDAVNPTSRGSIRREDFSCANLARGEADEPWYRGELVFRFGCSRACESGCAIRGFG